MFRDNLKSLAASDVKASEQIASNVIALKEVLHHGTIWFSKYIGEPSFPITPGNIFALLFI